MNKKFYSILIFSLFFLFALFSIFIINTINASTCTLSFSCNPSSSISSAIAKPAPLTSYCIISGTTESIGKCINSSIPIAVIGIVFAILMGGLAYMIGEVLEISRFKDWYKSEIWELVKSVLIVVIIFSLIIEIGGIANALIGNPTPNSSSISTTLSSFYASIQKNYIEPQLASAYNAYWGILGVSIGLSFMKSISIMLYIPLPVLPVPLGTVGALSFGVEENLFLSNILESMYTPYSFVNQAFTFIAVPLLMLFQFLHDLFIPLIGLSLSILLPIGIIFRAIPFLRPMGGMLIAIAFAFALVFPTLLLAINMPIQNFLEHIIVPPKISSHSKTSNINPLICTSLETIINLVKAPFCAISNALKDTKSLGEGILIGMFGPLSGIFSVFNFIIYLILPLIIEFLLLIIDLIITVVIAQNIAKLLGGTIKLGLGKLKLV